MKCAGGSHAVADDETSCSVCGMAMPSANSPILPEEPDQTDANTAATNIRTASYADIRAKAVVGTTGDNNTVFVEIKETINSSSTAEPSLLECISRFPDFPPIDPAVSGFLDVELPARTAVVATRRLLVITCGDPALARAAAQALIERLQVEPEKRKLLNFERMAAGWVPSIYQLVPPSLHRAEELVVLADAAQSERTQSFVDSLFPRADHTSAFDISSSLADSKLTVICLAHPQQVEGQGDATPACWNLSYARFLLRQRFEDGYEELEETIAQQRAEGGWSSDPAEFHKQLASLDRKQLMAAIGKGGFTKMAAAAERDPLPEEPLQMAVLYTATFYPNLAPQEFERVLTTLLWKQKQLVTETIQHKTKDGFVPVDMKRERELVDLWRERSYALMRECRLVTAKDAKRAITFSDLGRRDLLRRHFEEEYGLYVQKQFSAAYDRNLLFDPSEQIAKDVVDMSVEMARQYPDQFGAGWLYDVVTAACAGCSDDDSDRQTRTYQRIADLLQPMTREATLEGNVSGLLRRLLAAAHHTFAFEIVRKLRFAPNFDAFLWLRQVLDQGSEDVRERAYRYLHNEMKQPGRFYPLLQTLEPWLPPEQRDPRTYAPSQRAALRLVLEYTLETTMKFDPELYGTWPSRFPIAAVDSMNAEQHVGLLMRWLLHPGLARVFGEEFPQEHLHRLIPALISEWTFILLAPTTRNDGMRAADLTPVRLVTVIVRKLAETSNGSNPREVHKAILAYWEELKHFLAVAPPGMGVKGRAQRHEFTWKRELVRRLVTEFRQIQRELRPPSARPANA